MTAAIVTGDFARIYGRLGTRSNGEPRRDLSRYHKRNGHRRHRRAERLFLCREDWDGGVIAFRPITGRDAF